MYNFIAKTKKAVDNFLKEGDLNNMWNDKRYHTLDFELKKIFGEKSIKLSIDGNFTCPNRDGKIGEKGCIFCSKRGSGDFNSGSFKSINDQINEQKNFMSKKWVSNSYIAYFQNFTNTYDTVENLRIKYNQALDNKDIKGIAIATRPDCIDEEIVKLLDEINSKTFLWVELGLQTIHEKSARFLRRGYELPQFVKAVRLLKEKDIKIVVHLILGIPNESNEQIMESVQYISQLRLWGIKLHMLYIIKNTDLADYYNSQPFKIMSEKEYIKLVCDSLELLSPDTVIHRVTGDGKKSDLIEPIWSLNKLKVLSDIDKELKIRESYQGKYFEEIL